MQNLDLLDKEKMAEVLGGGVQQEAEQGTEQGLKLPQLNGEQMQ